jgi:hypothetical protein
MRCDCVVWIDVVQKILSGSKHIGLQKKGGEGGLISQLTCDRLFKDFD